MNQEEIKVLVESIDWDTISSEFTHLIMSKVSTNIGYSFKKDIDSHLVNWINNDTRSRVYNRYLTILAERPKAVEEPVPNWDEAPEGAEYYNEANGYFYKTMPGMILYNNPRWEESVMTIPSSKFTPRPKTEWDSTSLPPVGIECDIAFISGGDCNRKCTITYQGRGVGCAIMEDGLEFTFAHNSVNFYKVKSEEDRVVEAMLKLLAGKNLDVPGICKALYKAGYHPTEPSKTSA